MGLVMLDANIAFVAVYAGPYWQPGAAELFGTTCRATMKLEPWAGRPLSGGMGAGFDHYRVTEAFPDPPSAPCEFVVGDTVEISTISLGFVSASIVRWSLRAASKTTFELGVCLGLGFSIFRFRVSEVGPR
jgi:hypothetical protein